MRSDYQFVTIRKPESLKLAGRIALPPSKSETNRALVIGAFSDKPFTIENYSKSDDSRVVIDFLRQAGIRVDTDDSSCVVVGNIMDVKPETLEVDLKHAGTALRFLTALATFLPTTTILRGSEQLSRRPIATLIDTLTNVGANIEYLEESGRLPVRIQGSPDLDPTSFKIDVSQSSQMLSALLLVAPRQALGTRIYFDDNRLVSRSYIELTLQVLKRLGIHWKWKASCLELESNVIAADRYRVGGDWSAASYWLGLASTIVSDIELLDLDLDSAQGDRKQLEIFSGWGLQMRRSDAGLRLTNTDGNLVQPIDVDFESMPDLVQTFAVLSCYASGPSKLHHLKTLPYKETDRVAAISEQLTLLGIGVKRQNDSLKITPAAIHPQQPIETYEDHRMALSFSLLVNMADALQLHNPSVVNKSYPTFWDDLQSVGYEIQFE